MPRLVAVCLCFAPALMLAAPALAADPPLPAEALARVGSTRMRQGEQVGGMVFMPDGKTLVSVGRTGRLLFWDAATGELRRAIDAPKMPSFHLAVANDGSTIVVGGNEGFATLAADGRVVKEHRLGRGALVSLVTARDGKSICTIQRDGRVTISDTRTGDVRSQFAITIKDGRNYFFGDCSFLPDGKAVAIVDMYGKEIGMYEVATGKSYHTFASVQDMVRVVVVAPDGGAMATLGYRDDSLAIWDLATGKLRHHVNDVTLEPACVRFSPDGKTVAVGGGGPEIVLIDAVKGAVRRRLSWPPNTVPAIWYTTATSPPHVNRLTFSPDGKALAAVNADGITIQWNIATGERLPASADPGGAICGLQFLGQGDRLLALSTGIDVYDWRTGKRVTQVAQPRLGRSASVSRDGALIAAPNKDGAIELIDALTGQLRRSLTCAGGTPVHTIFTPDGMTLLCYDRTGTLYGWHTATGKLLGKWSGFNESAYPPVISPDGGILGALVPGGNGLELALWHVATGQVLQRLTLPPLHLEGGVFVTAMAFSPDGSVIAAGGQRVRPQGGRLIFWNVSSGKEIRTVDCHQDRVTCLAFAPDGRTLATGGADKMIHLWEVATGAKRHTFIGHQGELGALAFSADGRHLAAASLDAPVLVWDVYSLAKPSPVSGSAVRERLWQELAGKDVEVAFKAVRALAHSPAEALALFREHLKPVAKLDDKQVQQWLGDLDDPRFAAREKATAALRQRVDALEAALRETLTKPGTTAEAKRRLQSILDAARDPTPEQLRQARALEALEHAGGPEALRLLDQLAQGEPAARFTRAAKQASQRLRNR